MNLLVSLYAALLFVVLTPGVLVTIPKGCSKLTVAGVHGLIFAAVWYFTYRLVREAFQDYEDEDDYEEEDEGFISSSGFRTFWRAITRR